LTTSRSGGKDRQSIAPSAAALPTLVASPANPGGYRFGDYWKLGLPMLALFGVIAVFWVPVFWRF